MCIKHIDYFEVCGHNGKDDPHVAAFGEIEKCPAWDGESCKALRTRDVKHSGKCPSCAGNEDILWYKHCFQSEICDHEYGHALTDLERYRDEEDIVLVTPQYGLCPDCGEAGYDQRPGATALPKTASVMPKDFENLTRRPVDAVPRVSAIPPDDFNRAISSRRPDASRIPSSTYNPAANRVPASKAPSSAGCPSQAPKYTSQAQTQSRAPSNSQYPVNSQLPTTSRNQSKYPRESRQPSQYPASTAPSAKPATQIYSPVSKIPDEAASKKPVMSPADYLKRGAPKNVNPSAFYSNADGDGARARLGSVAPSQTRYSTRPSSVPKADSTAPRSYERTQAPPADAEGPDIDALMSGITLAPTQYPSERHGAQPSRTPGGHTVFPAQAMVSQAPGASKIQRSEAPRHSQMPSQSRAPSTSSVPRSEATRHLQMPSSTSRPSASTSRPLSSTAPHNASRAPELSSTSRPSPLSGPQPGQTALPNYKTMASAHNAFPSKAPPQYSGSHSVATNSTVPGSAVPQSLAQRSSVPKSTAPRAGGRNGDGRHEISSVPEEIEEGGSH